MSRLSRMALEVAAAIPGAADAQYFVFCSQHGEVGRSTPMIVDIAQGTEPSPTEFAMSVHNASAGQFSILNQCTRPAVSLAAGSATFVAGWLDADSWLSAHPDDRVLLVASDEALSEPYSRFIETAQRDHAAAFLLAAGDRRGVVLEPVDAGEEFTGTLPLEFVAWLESGKPELTVTTEGQGWRWRRVH